MSGDKEQQELLKCVCLCVSCHRRLHSLATEGVTQPEALEILMTQAQEIKEHNLQSALAALGRTS